MRGFLPALTLGALALSGFPGGNARAQGGPEASLLGDSPFGGSFGARVWFSTGETAKDLYDFDGSSLISRLTYDDLDSGSIEAFGEIDFYRLFLKGNAGLGDIFDGNLQDEDFEPFTFPYSSTDSAQKDGNLAYATLDLGAYLFDGERVNLGGFAGYNLLHQQVDAFGCEQTATSFICVPTIPETVAVLGPAAVFLSARNG